jgi:hypothetical protein
MQFTVSYTRAVWQLHVHALHVVQVKVSKFDSRAWLATASVVHACGMRFVHNTPLVK